MRRAGTGYSTVQRQQLSVSEFRGIDLCNAPDNVSLSRSPDAPNMIRDVPGKVRKRMGYHQVGAYNGRINGIYFLSLPAGEIELVHAGTKLYADGTELYNQMADARSKAWQLGDKVYIVDGRTFLRFDGQTVAPVSGEAYVPTVVISRNPSGGGVAHEGLNLLGSRWRESFLSDGTALVYQLSYDQLDADIEVSVMTARDVWTVRQQGTHYSFNAALGTVTFTSAGRPGLSPVDGADNVMITAGKQRPDYQRRINNCNMSVPFGVGGAADRLFVTGNPEMPGYDWYSGMNNPAYFPATGYCVLGMDTPVTGYSVMGERLAAHKSGDADGRNIIVREGVLVDGTAAFPIVNTLQGAGTASGHTVAYLKTEPLFLSRDGVYAVTPADVSGERHTQNRSFFINNALSALPDPADAVAVCYKDFYALAAGGRIYVLDSLLKSYEQGAPYSTHQYEAFVFTGVDARVLCRLNDRLRFGTGDGRVMEFYTDPGQPESYNDDGRPIEAYWDTPMLASGSFYRRKAFRYLALKLSAAPVTGAEVLAHINGIWRKLFEEFARLRYFTFSWVRFSDFTFSGDHTPKAFGRRLSLPLVDKARFRFKNGNLNEPFGLYNFAIEFRQNGRTR